jgi:hypothetical protein
VAGGESAINAEYGDTLYNQDSNFFDFRLHHTPPQHYRARIKIEALRLLSETTHHKTSRVLTNPLRHGGSHADE